MRLSCLLLALLAAGFASAQPATYCNPLNLDYAFIPSGHHFADSHRSTADPSMAFYQGQYYLFSTNQDGYWWSPNLSTWHFVPYLFKVNSSGDQVCAPAVWATKEAIYVLPSFAKPDKMPLYRSIDPQRGLWSTVVDSFPLSTWDPQLFQDQDKKWYCYWGSSNLYPIYGAEVNPQDAWRPVGEVRELLYLHPEQHGWERFGEDNSDSLTHPYIEGAWMIKYGGKYYLEYAAPGTEWNVYADGVYVSDQPLGPFVYQKYNPIAYKPGGFVRGAGHGSTLAGQWGNYWHIGTCVIWNKDRFERRLDLFPSGFEADGTLYTNTAFGDYPQYLATGPRDQRRSYFTGWMLLSYQKKTAASSALPNRTAELASDENIRTYWSAATDHPGEWLSMDLGGLYDLRALQVNYADDSVRVYDKQSGIYHQYQILHSLDGQHWEILIDKSQNRSDVPHDYVVLTKPVRTRYLKLVNVHMATGHFAIADLRVFGKGLGKKPGAVNHLTVQRQTDRRNARPQWEPVPGAYAYQIYFGLKPGRLDHSMLVYSANEHLFRGMDIGTSYYFAIEALSENGVGRRSKPVRVP
jgi:xylan 1,4-beta-xylosidase